MRDDFEGLPEEHLQNPEFKRAHDALEPEKRRIQAIADERKGSHQPVQSKLPLAVRMQKLENFIGKQFGIFRHIIQNGAGGGGLFVGSMENVVGRYV